MNKGLCFKALMIVAVLLAAAGAHAAGEAGSVVAVRGKASIERDQKRIEARAGNAVMVRDIMITGAASRAKLLFVDESVLTLGENSKVVIREFLLGREKAGSSIFNLIDGKLRSVVGKNAFEVHTPTSVAAARGTIILTETGVRNGKKYTTLIGIEGKFLVRSSDLRFPGEVEVSAGMEITIFEGEPLPLPGPASPRDRDRLLEGTDMTGFEISIPGPLSVVVGPGGMVTGPLGGFRPDLGLSPYQQPVRSTTPVNIDLIFSK